ncbi:MAG: hypothetical protein HON94_04850 [Methylococcales bacterium]|nr:hypothetical protein [Methylococcales bacterium]MBT7408166.1 hypothetical protein [Methylococcales bacterium]
MKIKAELSNSPARTKLMSLWYQLLKGLGVTTGMLLLLVLSLTFLLQSSWLASYLINFSKQTLAQQGMQLDVVNFKGNFPFNWQLDQLILSDQQGAWLNVKDVQFGLNSAQLLAMKIIVEQLTVVSVELKRLPVLSKNVIVKSSDKIQLPFFKLPNFPEKSPVEIEVKKILINAIDIDESVMGQTLYLKSSAQLSLIGDQLNASLKIQGQQTTNLSIEGRLSVILPKLVTTLNFNAQDKMGLIAKITKQPDIKEVLLSITGTGELADWNGKFNVEMSPLVKLDSQFKINLDQSNQIKLDADLLFFPQGDKFRLSRRATQLSFNLPDHLVTSQQAKQIAQITKDSVKLKINLKQIQDNVIEWKELSLNHPLINIHSIGKVDGNKNQLMHQLSLKTSLKKLSPILQQDLQGSLRLTLENHGQLFKPESELNIDVSSLKIDQLAIKKLRHQLNVTLNNKLQDDFNGATIKMSGELSDLTGGALYDKNFSWMTESKISASQQINLSLFQLKSPNINFLTRGFFNIKKRQGKFDSTLVLQQLNKIIKPMPEAITVNGQGNIESIVTISPELSKFDLQQTIRLSHLKGLPRVAQVLTADALMMHLSSQLVPQQTLQVENFELVTKNMKATVFGDIELNNSKKIKLQATLKMPELNVLSSVLKQPIAGELSLYSTIKGSQNEPKLNASLLLKQLKLSGQEIQHALVALDADQIQSAPQGQMSFQLRDQQQNITLTSQYQYQKIANQLDFRHVKLLAPATKLKGNLSVDLHKTLINGQISGKIHQLLALKPWHHQHIEGGVSINTHFKPVQQQQQVKSQVVLENMTGAIGNLSLAKLTATLSDVFNALSFKAQLQVKNYQKQHTKLHSAKLELTGDRTNIHLKNQLIGHHVKDFSINNQTHIELNEKVAINIQSLTGKVAGNHLKLNKPLSVSLNPNHKILTTPLNLSWSDALLQSSEFRYSSMAMQGQLEINFPMSLLQQFDAPEMTGGFYGKLDFTGSPEKPVMMLNSHVKQLQFAHLKNMPKSRIELNVQLNHQQLTADITTDKLTVKPIIGHVLLPLSFSLQPFNFEWVENKLMSGKLFAKVDLHKMTQMITLDEQELAGLLALNTQLSGTKKHPQLTVSIDLDHGKYENLQTGTLLNDIEMKIAGNQDQLKLQQLKFNDGEKGSVTGVGQVDLINKKFPFQVDLKLDQAVLIRLDEFTGTLSGDFKLNGNKETAMIQSDLVMNQASINIPSSAGSTVARIEVEEVVSAEETMQQQTPKTTPVFKAGLDVNLSIPARCYVRGRGLESEWAGKISVTGNTEKPIVLGNLNVKRGALDFLDRKFIIKKGEIDFNGSNPPIPMIDLNAEFKTKKITGIVKVTGNASNPQLKLESQPSLPQDEILANILFGRSASEITPAQAVSLAASIHQLKGGNSGPGMMDKLRNKIGLDNLGIEGDGLKNSSIKAGKYVTDDIYVEIEEGLKSSKLSVEMQLTPQITIDAEVDKRNNSGVGINWKKDY